MKKILALLVLVIAALGAAADTYTYLNFVNASSSISQFEVDGLLITFSNGNAVVTSGSTTSAVPLATLSYLEFSNTQAGSTTYATGDINADGKVDVSDMNILINIILGNDNADNYGTRPYLNGSSAVDVADLNIMISLLLEQ